MDTNFNNLALKAAAEEASITMKMNMGPLTYFAHNFTPTYADAYSGIAVPVYDLTASEFSDTNNWGNGTQLSGEIVNLDSHPKTGIKLTDVEYGQSDVNYLRDGSRAITEAIVEACQRKVYDQLTGASGVSAITTGIASSAMALSAMPTIYQAVATAGINASGAVILLNPTAYAGLLKGLDYQVYGGIEAIRSGVIPGLFGFKAVVQCPWLGTTTKGGFVVGADALAIASRLNRPVVNNYHTTFESKNADGISIGFRIHEDLNAGALLFGGDTLFGCKVVNVKQIRSLTFTA